MPLDTIKAFATKKRDDYESLKSTAQLDLSTAQNALAGAINESKKLTATLQEKIEKRTKTLADLGKVPMAGDADPLVKDLADLTLEIRTLQGDILDANDKLGAAEALVARAAAQLGRASKNLPIAERELTDADAQSKKQAAWMESCMMQPLSKLASVFDGNQVYGGGDARKVLDGLDYSQAKIRVEKIPEALRIRATNRVVDETGKVDAWRLDVTTKESALVEALDKGGLTGAAANLRAVFDKQHRLLRDRATLSLTQLESAVRLLKGIHTAPAIPKAEMDRILEVQEDFEENEEQLDKAVTDRNTKEAEYNNTAHEDQTLEMNEELNTAEALVTTLEGIRDNLFPVWEATIPESAIQQLQDFGDATRMLEDLDAADMAQVVTAFTTAEANLANALFAVVENEDETAKLAESLVEVRAALDRASNPARVFQALLSGA